MRVNTKTINEYVLSEEEAITIFRVLEYTRHRQIKHNKAPHIALLHVHRLLEDFRKALGK